MEKRIQQLKDSRTKWIGFGFLFLILVKAGIGPLICADYELRKAYIIKNICVNRNKPQLHCNGKCYLAKKLAENQRQEEKAAENGFLASMIYQVMQDDSLRFAFEFPPFTSFSAEKVAFKFSSPFFDKPVVAGIFRPPLC